MRQYYFAISRLSLGVIILQALIFIYFACNTAKINQRIENTILAESMHPAPVSRLQPAFNRLYQTLYNFQMENQRHNWIFWTITGCGFLHVICLYSFYIYFLRMGHTWTKLLLHLNNMSMALVLPGGLGFTWVVGYIIGTRLVKHFCVVASMKSSSSD
jgi:hypothetical protein